MSAPAFIRSLAALVAAALALCACNSGEETLPPEITLDSPTGVYAVKVGVALTIAPTVRNGDGARYSWLLDGAEIGTASTLTHTFAQPGKYYIKLRVSAAGGSVSEELRVDVAELLPPVISFAEPAAGINLLPQARYTFAPAVANASSASFEWLLDGRSVGSGRSYTFAQPELGDYTLTLRVRNDDGSDERSLTVCVVAQMPLSALFAEPNHFLQAGGCKYVALGRTIVLRPVVEGASQPAFRWSVDGEPVAGASGPTLRFTPAAGGSYRVEVSVAQGAYAASAAVTVVCCGEELSTMRAATAVSRARSDRVYEYLPAPGQFINETVLGGFAGQSTHAQAVAYAQERLAASQFVSLGGFGGYIVVGFDHSIPNSGGYDFSIEGNQFRGSSEPGIVWVMQDTNGNGLPDDEWYELRGSETGAEGTWTDYAVTYTRPEAARSSVPWVDNRGNSGTIDWIAVHRQDCYYPLWMEQQSYTLRGTRIEKRIWQDASSSEWVMGPYDWGYADNFGDDRGGSGDNPDAAPQKVYFKISNAMQADGTDAELRFIDFIRVQTAVNAQQPPVGELSTEVMGFTDENLR